MNVTISTDKTRLDIALIHRVLSVSYWAEGRTLQTVRASIDGSLCFGVYEGKAQVGFARVITDYATFAYLADVFMVETYQGRGLGKRLVGTVLRHRGLQTCNWTLFTKDAHALYARFGFEQPAEPERLLRRKSVEVLKLGDET
jgi:GNAT superfamily N-acetyltransferase